MIKMAVKKRSSVNTCVEVDLSKDFKKLVEDYIDLDCDIILPSNKSARMYSVIEQRKIAEKLARMFVDAYSEAMEKVGE